MSHVKPRLHARGWTPRTIPSVVKIDRTGAKDNRAFHACIRVGLGRGQNKTGSCAFAKNPRKALAAALRAHAKKVGARKGAFAGKRGKR